MESIGKQIVNIGDKQLQIVVRTNDWSEGFIRLSGEEKEVEYLYDIEGRVNSSGFQVAVWRVKE